MADVKRALELLADSVRESKHGFHGTARRRIEEAIAALTAEPALPEGWTCEQVTYALGKAWIYRKPNSARIEVYEDGEATVAHSRVTAAELHAVLAHHLAREAGK